MLNIILISKQVFSYHSWIVKFLSLDLVKKTQLSGQNYSFFEVFVICTQTAINFMEYKKTCMVKLYNWMAIFNENDFFMILYIHKYYFIIICFS